jgi:hypothetical protein
MRPVCTTTLPTTENVNAGVAAAFVTLYTQGFRRERARERYMRPRLSIGTDLDIPLRGAREFSSVELYAPAKCLDIS